jgi:hypothetical protein
MTASLLVAGIVLFFFGRWLDVRSAVRVKARVREGERDVRRKQDLR